MRIGLFSDTYLPDINGVVSSIVTLQRELEKNGHVVFVITNHPALLHSSFENNVLRLPGIEIKSLYGYVLTSPIHFAAYSDIKAMNLEVIHVHTEFGVGIFGRIIGRMLQIPVVSTYHTTYEDYTHYVNFFNLKTVENVAKKGVSRLSKLYGSSCTELIAPSFKTKEMLYRYGIKKDIFVIPTGLDLEKFDRAQTSPEKIRSIRTEFGINEHDCLVVYLGRIAKEKSIDFVIDGISLIDQTVNPCKLLIVGGGPEEDSLKEQVERLNLNGIVLFAGKKPSDEVPSYYHAANAFVSASLTETQGMTFIEALASELPVFARPDEVLTELIIEGKTGFYFRTPQQFAEKLQDYLLLSESEKQEIRNQSKSHVAEYDSRVFYRSIMEAYNAAITHYHNSYTLTNIRYKNEAVECTLVGRNETIKCNVSTDMFVKKGLRRNKVITDKIVQELMMDEKVVKAYQSCIRKLTLKDRTRREMYDYLTQETELPIKQVNELIEMLEKRGYVDDVRYVNSAVMNLRSLLQGRNKIVRSLLQKGIPFEMIDKAMRDDGDEHEINIALRWAEKIQPTIKDKSLKFKRQQMAQRLLAQGFEKDIVDVVMESLSFVDDEKQELERLRKAASKARRRYENKLEGSRLRNSVYRYLSTQGYQSEDIYLVLNEMEWKDE